MEQTARVLSQLGSKDQPSKEFQSLVRQIGEAKTKHVSHNVSVKLLNIWTSWASHTSTVKPSEYWDVLGVWEVSFIQRPPLFGDNIMHSCVSMDLMHQYRSESLNSFAFLKRT